MPVGGVWALRAFHGAVCQVCGEKKTETETDHDQQATKAGKKAQKGPSGTEEATSIRKKINDRLIMYNGY
jgi:hypothetical protein